VTTNVAFLGRIAASRAFSAAELDTGSSSANRAGSSRRGAPRRPKCSGRRLRGARRRGAGGARQAQVTGDPALALVRGRRLAAERSAHHDFTFWTATNAMP